MIRLTAHITGRVQRVGYRAKVVSLANELGLVGLVLNQPDGSVLVIAEGKKKEDLERFASAIRIENAFIHVDDLSADYAQGTGQYSAFRKITSPEEVGERLDDGIEILKEMAISLKNMNASLNSMNAGINNANVSLNNLTTITKDGFESLTTLTKEGFENLGGKIDQTLDKQDETIEEIRGLRVDLKSYMDRKFKRIEADLAELKEMKAALKEKGLI
jgi:acylphosphatase